MKKLFITLAFIAAGFFAQAQLYVGGSLGFGTEGGKTINKNGGVETTIDAPKMLSFTIAPEIGYMFSDNMGAGVELGFGLGRKKSGSDGNATTIKDVAWAVSPYFRYIFAEPGDLRFYADAKVILAGDKPTKKVESDGYSTTSEGAKTFEFGIGIVPGMQYFVSDNFIIDAKLNILGLGYNMKSVTENIDENSQEITKTNTFGFGVNGQTDLSIGFIYQF